MVDALGSGKGTRMLTRDVIGCGPRWICGVLDRLGVHSRIQLAEDFIRKNGRGNDIDLVLVSAMSMDFSSVRKIARRAKRLMPSALRVIGGPVSGTPVRALRAGYDFVVMGEGEKAIESIIGEGDPSEVPGIGYRDGTEFRVNPARKGLTQEEYAKYHPSTERILDYPTFWASRVYVEVVRGCSNFNRTRIPLADGRRCTECSEDCRDQDCPERIPHGCGFCAVPATFGPPKSREVGPVAREIRELVNLGASRIVLSGPDVLDFHRGKGERKPSRPGANLRMLRELLEAAVDSSAGRASISLENVKPSLLSGDAAELISRLLPSTEIHIGCETGDEDHSRSLGRPSTPMESLRATRVARKHGLRPIAYFIHGLPGQTRETAGKTVEMMRKMEPFVEKITVYRFKPLPGSAFENESPGPPRWRDDSSRMISEAAREINRRKKREYMGKTVEGFLVERNLQRGDELIFYPSCGGPIVTVRAARELIGRRAKIKIKGVVSERLLSGEILETGSEWKESR